MWADRNGFDLLVLSEHHGVDDGWQPAPLTVAAAVLGMTERARVMISAVVLPLHDPIRVAEQIAVLDNVAPGRLRVVFGAGYRVPEVRDGRHGARRAWSHPRGVRRGHQEAWTGEAFEWRGRTIMVTPKPATEPHPMVLVGGGVPAAARRAARLRLPMLPMNTDQSVRRLLRGGGQGRLPGFLIVPTGPTFVFVTDDPDRTWSQIGRYLLYEAHTTRRTRPRGSTRRRVHAESVDDLKASPQYVVGTPDRCSSGGKRSRRWRHHAHPLAGGLPPDLAWESLELFAGWVMPQLRVTRGEPFGLIATVLSHSRGVPSPHSPEEVGNGPVPSFRHHPSRHGRSRNRAGSDRGCEIPTSRTPHRDERARACARRAGACTASTNGGRASVSRWLAARGVDASHRRDRGTGRVPRRARRRGASSLHSRRAPAT